MCALLVGSLAGSSGADRREGEAGAGAGGWFEALWGRKSYLLFYLYLVDLVNGKDSGDRFQREFLIFQS